MKMRLPDRKSDSHKYDNGHLLVVGGSKVYSGSPTFNSISAYRVGTDIVTTLAPENASRTIAAFSPTLITKPLSEDNLSSSDLPQIKETAEKADAFVLGGGLGRNKETLETVAKFLDQTELPGVIDADAIHAYNIMNKQKLKDKNFVFTPHLNEFKLMSGQKPLEFKDKKETVEKTAERINSVILLKGKKDIISNGSRTEINETGHSGMTVGGTGDVLAGIAGGLISQGEECFTAAETAAWLCGRAGEIASSQSNKRSLLPEDVVNNLPEALTQLQLES